MLRSKLKKQDGKLYEMIKWSYRCDLCKDIIESKTVELIKCNCGNLSLIGGVEYGGLIACIFDCITDMSEWRLIK
jgi:hypothetical protein